MNKTQNEKKILWYNLAFMAFSTVWGFGNVINGFSEYGGLKAIVSWLILFAVYFIPYALMVGELGSTFKNENGGVSSWIRRTISPGMAYMADGPTGSCTCPIFPRSPTLPSSRPAGSFSVTPEPAR